MTLPGTSVRDAMLTKVFSATPRPGRVQGGPSIKQAPAPGQKHVKVM